MQRTDVAIVGGGQAGLVMSHRLKERGIDHIVLEAEAAPGSSWTHRWDSLRLITPGWMNSLPGMAFPGDPDAFAPGDDVSAYLERYAAFVNPTVWNGARVERVEATERGSRVHVGGEALEAGAVVLATGPFRRPAVPPFASALSSGVTQLTTSSYRSPAQLPAGRVMVVGSGNSGAGIAADLVETHEVLWAMGDTPRLPRRATGQAFNDVMGRLGAPPLVRDPDDLAREADWMWWFNRVGVFRLERTNPMAARLAAATSDPAFVQPATDPLAHGATRVPRVTGAEGGSVVTADGARHAVDSVVWATGFRPDVPDVDPGVLDADGRPAQQRGVTAAPGVYFLGLRFMHRLGSGLFFGVAEDAEHLAAVIEERLAGHVA